MRLWLILAALNAVLSIALGAYGAHGFDAQSQGYEISLMEKASRYQMTNALALLGVAWASDRWGGPWVAAAGGLFVLGSVLFCGALYVTAMTDLAAGAAAPYGGFSMMAAWVALAVSARRAPGLTK